MIRLRSSGLYVLLLCFVSGVLAVQNAGFYNCTPWTDGDTVTITYFIERSKFPSACKQMVTGLPKFRMSVNSSVISNINCTVPFDIRIPGSCNFISGALGCGCTDESVTIESEDYYRIEYNFIAGPDYQRWWEAIVDCSELDFSAALNYSQTGCQTIPNATTTTSTTAETTEQTTAQTNNNSGGGNAKTIGGAVGGTVAVLAAVGVVAFAVYRSKKKRAGMCNNTTTDVPPTANGNNSGMPETPREKPLINNGGDDSSKPPIQPSGTESEVSQSDVSLVSGSAPTATGALACKPRQLPQPKKDGRAGQMVSYSVGDEALEGPRKLPQPHGKEQVTPRLAPLSTNASSPLTSVERNSYADTTRQPLPPISK